MKVKNIRHLMLGIICLVLAVICLAVGAAGGSAPKYLISAVLLLALAAGIGIYAFTHGFYRAR